MKYQKSRRTQRQRPNSGFWNDWRFQVGAAVILALLLFAVPQIISHMSQGKQKNTVVLTVNEHQVKAVTFNYYFRDCYDEFTTTYAEAFGGSRPIQSNLDQQQYDGEATYADCFCDMALENAQRTVLIVAAARDATQALKGNVQQEVDTEIVTMRQRAVQQGYVDLDSFLQSFYGPLASEATYREYLSQRKLAEAYSQYIYDSVPVTTSGEEAQAQRQAAWDQWFAQVTEDCETICDSAIQTFLYMEP